MDQQQQFQPSDEPPQGSVIPKAQAFQTLYLTEDDIPAFQCLQEKVWNSLAEDEKHFLKIRTKEDLCAHLDARMPILGIKSEDGKLVAQCLLSYPIYNEAVRNLNGYPLSGREATTAILQSVAVDPDLSNNGLMRALINTAKDVAAKNGHTHILAKVAHANVVSSLGFLGRGFSVACEDKDPEKGYAVTYWQIPLYECGAASRDVALTPQMA